MRKSIIHSTLASRRESGWQRYTGEPGTSMPAVPPTPIWRASQALSADPHDAIPPVPPIPIQYSDLARPLPPESVIPATDEWASSRWTTEQMSRPEMLRPNAPRRPRLEDLTWGHSYFSDFIPSSSRNTQGDLVRQSGSEYMTEMTASAALPSSVAHAIPVPWHHKQSSTPYTASHSASGNTSNNGKHHALQSSALENQNAEHHQSVYSNGAETIQSIYSQPENRCLADWPEGIGRAISAPGRSSVELALHPTPSSVSGLTSGQNDRSLTGISHSSACGNESGSKQLPVPPGPPYGQDGILMRGHESSLFEYSGMAGTSVAGGRNTQYTQRTERSGATETESTHSRYDKPIWDTSATPLSSAAKGKGGTIMATSEGVSGDLRKSRGKSVRWGDEEEPLPRVFELARAL